MTYQTALEFTYIEFDKNWTSAGTVQYIATNDKAQLIVVAEGKTGVKTTYWFQADKSDIVLVSDYANIVYIPQKCIRREAGDKTKCLKNKEQESEE